MDFSDLLAELCALRWEVPEPAEFAREIGTAVRAHAPIKGLELGLGGAEAWVVRWPGPTVVEVDAIEPTGPERKSRPRSGWGSTRLDRIGAEVGATRRWSIPLPGRHGAGYLVVWAGRSGRTLASFEQSMEALTCVIGMLVDAHVLLHRVARLSRHAHADNARLRRDLRQTLGLDEPTRSIVMRRCLERAQAVAPYDTPVLVTGPSGAGKELIARRIHSRSTRSGGPFVQVNCGALPQGLVESELFGHERGAFTGAVARHRGVFERAAGGTLLLDEIGDLRPPAQVKLLRVLQEGTFARVGAESLIRSDARVIAATHRDLPALVAAGEFREDLFYRLAVFEVRVPALRERMEDLPPLVHALVERIARRMGRPAPRIPRAALARLAEHDWPGNVRELENRLEAALVMSRGDILEVSPLRRSTPAAAPATVVEPLEHSIRRALESALTATRGKIYGPGGAAERLGLKPGTLQSKLRKLGIDRRSFVTATPEG